MLRFPEENRMSRIDDRPARPFQTVTIRLPLPIYHSVMIASARAGKSMNEWISDICEAASASSDAMALLNEMSSRRMATDRVMLEVSQQALELLRRSIKFAGEQCGLAEDGLEKMTGIIESWRSAQAIREQR